MAEPAPLGFSSASPLDARLREMLRELPREHAGLLEALLQERDLLVTLAQRRAERMQRLLEGSGSLLRTFDRDEIEGEVARQFLRLVPCDGVVVLRAGVDGEPPALVVHQTLQGPESLDVVMPAVTEAVQEAVRTGRAARLTAAGGVAMAIPVMHGFRLLGLVAAYARFGGAFTGEDLEASQALAAQAATAIVNASLYSQSERERRQSDAFASLARALGAAQRPHEVLRLAMRHAMLLFGVDGVFISRRRDDFLLITAADGSVRGLQGMVLPVAGTLSGRAALERRAVVCNDTTQDAEARALTSQHAGVKRCVVAPFIAGSDVTGTISIVNRERPFDAEDARLLQQFAAQVSVAVTNARLYEEAADSQQEISAAFEAVGDGLVVLDGDGRVVRCNGRFFAVTGFPEADGAVGRDFYDVVLQEARELTEQCVVGKAVLAGQLARTQLRSAWNNHVLEVVAAPHPAGGAVVSVDDVTEFLALAERHRFVVDNTTDAILITTAEGVLEFANAAADRLFGADAPLAGMRLAEMMPASEATQWAEALARARRGAEVRLTGVVNRGGERRQVSVSVAPMIDDHRVSRLVLSLRDVTDEAMARDESAAANARYRDLVEMAADAIVTLDVRGMFTSVNPAMETLTGHGRDAILGRSFMSFLEPSESSAVEREFALVAAGATRRTELHFTRADDQRRLLSLALTPMRRAGVVVGVLAMARDVTEEREQAAALSHAEARYTRLVESAEDAIGCVDEEGCFTAVNRALEKVLGVPREQLLGSHFMEAMDDAERPKMWQAFAAALAGQRDRRTIRFTRPDGIRGFATLVTAPIIEAGRVTGALGIARDVTEEQMLLEQAVRQDKMVAMGELVGGVAHEVNSPLTSILTYAHMLGREGMSDGDRQAAVAMIGKEAQRAARIVGKLLAFARQGAPERTPSDINQALRDTLDLRRYALKMQEIRLSVSLAEALPLIEADPFQLQQVFINLLANAEQAVAHQSGPKEIRVSSEIREGAVVVTIADNGPGIPPEALPHIFNPFFTTKPRGMGTGLGLSISDGIVREHRGTLRVRSQPGEGATFEVELPLSPATPT